MRCATEPNTPQYRPLFQHHSEWELLRFPRLLLTRLHKQEKTTREQTELGLSVAERSRLLRILGASFVAWLE
jgi:hypothetical protein